MISSQAPVFVLGSPRSGTTLLYHMLLSAGDFAVYRAETHVFDLLGPRFGDLRRLKARAELIDDWLTTEYFQRTGLDAAKLRQRVLTECRNAGDFLRIVMESIATHQAVSRWAECTPEHLLYIDTIKRTIPDAKIIHIIRDGRDVALSLEKQGWIRPLPIDRDRGLLIAGVYWEWQVNKGRAAGRRFAPDYLEIKFEDLVSRPQEALDVVGTFIGQPLDYAQILSNPVGSVATPNTSFATSSAEAGFNPVGRWRSPAPPRLAQLETAIGKTLQDLGYDLVTRSDSTVDFMSASVGLRYGALFESKHWLKNKTPLGRFSDISLLHRPIGEDLAQPKNSK